MILTPEMEDIIEENFEGSCDWCEDPIARKEIFAIVELEKVSKDGYGRITQPYQFLCSEFCRDRLVTWHTEYGAFDYKKEVI